jgi:predicted CXXCH cytochrome family protein
MRRIAIRAAIVLPVILILAFSATALAYNVTPPDGGTALATDIAPHDGFNTGGGTDYCIQCHDIHQAQGDYVLTRQSTVTATCNTCHALFGAAPNPGQAPDWTHNPLTGAANPSGNPSPMTGTPPTTSDLLAYNVNMSGATAQYMDSIPGHSLGVMAGGTIVRNSDSIPDSSSTLKVMISGEYGGYNLGYYSGTSVTSFTGTQGLYCASCHSPHGAVADGGVGNVIPGNTMLLSARPNHITTPVASYSDGSFCLACHDKNLGVDASQKTHPSQFCLSCHGDEASGGGTQDFPHTSTNHRLLTTEPDALCLECHTAGTLP